MLTCCFFQALKQSPSWLSTVNTQQWCLTRTVWLLRHWKPVILLFTRTANWRRRGSTRNSFAEMAFYTHTRRLPWCREFCLFVCTSKTNVIVFVQAAILLWVNDYASLNVQQGTGTLMLDLMMTKTSVMMKMKITFLTRVLLTKKIANRLTLTLTWATVSER